VSLAAREFEAHGIATAAISFGSRHSGEPPLPRALVARYRHGFPDDPADTPGRLRALVTAALRLLDEEGQGPLFSTFDERRM
jgi:hypothetical protein